MTYSKCRVCGGRIIFRYSRVRPDGTVEHRAKPFPIHIDGPCSS
jgi:hypothetical protein